MKKTSALLIVLIIGLAGIPTLSRNVQPVKALYSVVEIGISANGSITPADAPITNFGNSTYTLTDDVNITAHYGYSPAGIRIKRSNITFNGNGHILTGHGGNCFYLEGPPEVGNVTIENSTAKGFDIRLYLGGSYNNVIRGNTFSGSGVNSNVRLQGAGNNTFIGNVITNGGWGVEMGYAGPDNTFIENYILNNTGWTIGWHLGGGGAHFYHNVIGGSIAAMYEPACTWDNGYPSGGNYWIGYVSPDMYSGPYQNITGGDGIGDTPKALDAEDIDHYPFMLVSICNVSQTPPKDNVLSTDIVRVNATVTHLNPLEQVILNCTYSNSSTTWTSSINMTNLEDGVWNATISSSPVGTNVTYAIIAQDNAGNSISSKDQGYTFDYPVVIPEFPTYALLLVLFVTTLSVALVLRRKRIT